MMTLEFDPHLSHLAASAAADGDHHHRNPEGDGDNDLPLNPVPHHPLPNSPHSAPHPLPHPTRDGEPCYLFVGPEGDFTPAELAAIQEAGALPVGLGPNRLRTETAALSLLAVAVAFADDGS